ncbi:MAG: protein kinase [Gemmataceae bacterium]|nr:protein kinase [Gemmataceae bacterium]
MPWQFRVVDGANQGEIFALPEGVSPIGTNRRHAEIVLNDLYVARIHAEVDVDGDRVVVTDSGNSPAGTLVNGQRIRQQEIRHGDIVRVGNSHLRLEDVAIAASESPRSEDDDVPAYDIEVMEDGDTPAAATAGATAPSAGAAVSAAAPGPATAAAVEDIVEVEVIDEPDEPPKPEIHPLPGERLKELVGHPLAHFQVEEVIAMGKCSVVFQARDLKSDRLVALKVLATDFPKGEAEMKRYVPVWKAVLPLRHPNLVTLYGVGKTGPFCWLSYELVEHAPLPEIIDRVSRKDKIDWHRPFRIATQIARALDYSHKHKIVHRNITAGHILWNSGEKVAKLADLGLAMALEGSNLVQITLRDRLQADLPYYPPEQTEPSNQVDGLCDIYSLGVVVYALMTGRFPFVGNSQAELIRNIRDAKPVRPSKLQPSIPKKFDAIIMKMLAKKRDERYPTAEALLHDLHIVAEEEDALV